MEMIPMVEEANAISEELDRKVKFEIVVMSPKARGLAHGRTEVNTDMLSQCLKTSGYSCVCVECSLQSSVSRLLVITFSPTKIVHYVTLL